MRYRGYLGEVTVAGDLLLLTSHAHGPQRQWQLALGDIGQVRLSMPEGERPGSLQVLPVAPAADGYTAPQGDEYTVQFEAGDADTFTALAAWLEEIVQLNLSDDEAPAEDVGGAADEDDGTLVFWGVSDLPAAPEPTAQAPPYAMRLLVAGSITAVLLVAVVVLTWPGGGKKAADHSTAQPTRSSTSAPATPSDGFSITPPVPPSVSPLHQTWSPYPRHTKSPRPGGPSPTYSPPGKPPGGDKRVVLGTQCAQHYAYATDTAGDQVQCLPEPGMHPGGKLVWRWQLPGIIPNG
jgi:hypothetical protein